jgi:hypothetical protein
MKKEIVYTDKYALILSDERIEDVRPHKGKFHLEQGLFINQFPTYLTDLSYCKLIIAHLPLSDAPILEGVPLLPPLSQGDDVDIVENLAGNYALNRGVSKGIEQRMIDGFVNGYNKAKEKYKYTEEDVRRAIEMSKDIKYVTFSIDEIIQSLQQPSRPTHFEFETTPMNLDEIREQGKGFLNANIHKIKTTTNSQGHLELVGKYLNL